MNLDVPKASANSPDGDDRIIRNLDTGRYVGQIIAGLSVASQDSDVAF